MPWPQVRILPGAPHFRRSKLRHVNACRSSVVDLRTVALLAPRGGFPLHFRVEDHVEQLRYFGFDLLVLADADACEERLVCQATILVVTSSVDPPDVGCEVETVIDVVPCFGVVVVVLCDTVIDRGDLSAEPVLELRELLQTQGVFQVRFEQPVLLCDVLRGGLLSFGLNLGFMPPA